MGGAAPDREEITLKATGEDTGGAIGVLDATATAPGAGPSPHVHHDCDELFYILAGQFSFLVDSRMVSAPAGAFVFVPRGTVRAAQKIGPEAGRLLAAYIPTGAEQAFEEFARTSPKQRNDPARKFSSEFVGPPGFPPLDR